MSKSFTTPANPPIATNAAGQTDRAPGVPFSAHATAAVAPTPSTAAIHASNDRSPTDTTDQSLVRLR